MRRPSKKEPKRLLLGNLETNSRKELLVCEVQGIKGLHQPLQGVQPCKQKSLKMPCKQKSLKMPCKQKSLKIMEPNHMSKK